MKGGGLRWVAVKLVRRTMKPWACVTCGVEIPIGRPAIRSADMVRMVTYAEEQKPPRYEHLTCYDNRMMTK